MKGQMGLTDRHGNSTEGNNGKQRNGELIPALSQ